MDREKNWEVPIYLNYTQCKLYAIWGELFTSHRLLPPEVYIRYPLHCHFLRSSMGHGSFIKPALFRWPRLLGNAISACRGAVSDCCFPLLEFNGFCLLWALTPPRHHSSSCGRKRHAFGSSRPAWLEVCSDEMEVTGMRTGCGRFLEAKGSCVWDVRGALVSLLPHPAS